MTEDFIAIDWGSSFLKAYHIAEDKMLDHFKSDKGVKNVTSKEEYPLIIKDIIHRFKNANENTPLLLTGMVGGASGWINTPYISCPFELNQMAKNLIYAKTGSRFTNPVYIMPGLAVKNAHTASFGVIRGEEVQLIGSTINQVFDLIIIPGTHSKWVFMNDKSSTMVNSFSTMMTGELYQVLLDHSLLGAAVTDKGFNDKGFVKGLWEGKTNDNVIAALFSTRSRVMLEDLKAEEGSSYLSGMLIAAEIKSHLRYITYKHRIAVVAGKKLSELYKKAFDFFNIPHIVYLDMDEINIKAYALLGSKMHKLRRDIAID